MAKKTSKKLISILLSILMVASSIPFAAFTALADSASDRDALQAQVDAFVQKMDGTYFTNMSAAYDSYVKANAKLDVYDATGYDSGMAAAKTDLENKMAQMGTFTSKQGTALGKMSKDDTYVSDEYYAKVYKNLLYSPQASEVGNQKQAFGSSWTGSNGATFRMHYATTVMLYDGIVEPTMGVLGEVSNYYTGTWSRNTRDYAMNMNSNTANGLVFARSDGWVGYDNRKDKNRGPNFQWTYFTQSNILPYSPSGTQYYTHDGDSNMSWTNIIKYTGDFTEGSYSKTITPTFTYIGGNKDTKAPYVTFTVTGNNNPIYVINYKAILDTMTKNKSKITLKGAAASYEQGGLASVLRAYDAVMAVDPTSYDYSNTASAVTNCANAIKSAVDGLNSATATADGTGYDKLIDELKASKNTYDAGIADPDVAGSYVDGTWDAFKNSYESAGSIFESLATNGYTQDAQAGQLADTLKANREALKVAGKVDASELITAIENAEAVINASRYFTADSYAASDIEAVVAAAKVAIWGSSEFYGVEAKLPADSATSQAAVKAQATAVRNALMKVKINKDAVVVASGVSYNQAVAEAAPYMAKADDYSNSSKLQEALDDAAAYADDDTLIVDAAIEGHAHYVIETYASGVNAIMFAIQSLTPSFSKITDGTFASIGEKETTTIDSAHKAGYWMLDFSRYTGTILFKTTHTATDYDLPDAQFAFKTNRTQDQLLDSININADADLPNDEIISISSSQAITDDAKGWALNGAQCATYTGLLSMSNGGIELNFHDLYCSAYKGNHGQVGYTAITDGNSRQQVPFDQMYTYKWDDDLLVTQGTEPFSGGITAKSASDSGYGSTTLNAKMTISTKATNSKLFDTDRATGEITGLAGAVKLTKFDTSNSSSYIGMTYSWAYHPFNYFHGYSYDRAQYVQQIYVVDIASLLDLISYAESLDATQYSNNSWAALTDALIAAKDEMPYAGMSADEIYAACDTRLQNLFDAIMALEAPANNTALREAINLVQSTYMNDEAKCETTTWTAFRNEYLALSQLLMNKYSDKNVRDFGVDDQDAIDAEANALIEAYNNLVHYADFAVIKNAVALLASSVESKEYTATQLDALKAAVESVSDAAAVEFYIANMAAVNAVIDGTSADASIIDQMHGFYDSQNPNFADSQANILDAANTVAGLGSTLEKGTIDTSALEAAIDNVYDSYKDPDAWHGIDEAVAAIRNMNLYADYDLYGYPKQVFAFEDTTNVNAAVEEILQGEHAVTKQKYSVKLTDTNGSVTDLGTFDYGTKVYVGSDGSISTTENSYAGLDKTDWYYAYESNTAKNTEKFVGTDTFLAFVVKGNTNLRIKTAAVITEMVKVTYVNQLNGQAYLVDYVAPGTVVTPAQAPLYNKYTFKNYTVDGSAITSVTVNEDTTITANYDYTDATDTFSVTLANLAVNLKSTPITESGLKYNDLITCDSSMVNKADSKDTNPVSYEINHNAVTTTYTKKAVTAAQKLTYWAVVDADYVDAWMSYLTDSTATSFANLVKKDATAVDGVYPDLLLNSLRIVGVGDKLNYRVHEDALIIALTKADYDALTGQAGGRKYITGIDANMASAYAREDVVMGEDSFSIISNYVLPEGATMVETGILFQSNGDNTDTTTALTFNNVGKKAAGEKLAVARMKSTQHTAGNQYVMTIGSSKLSGTVKMRYSAYVIYDIGGTQYTYVQPTVSTSANF